MSNLVQNLRYALRQLRKSPGFTTTAVLTLALGIGANTAIFSVINAVLLRPLPYREPARLVTLEHLYPSLDNLQAPVSVPGFLDYQAQSQTFEHAAVETGWGPNLTGRGDPERLRGSQVSGDYFGTLGVPAELGRGLQNDEAQAGHEKVVVLSHGLWQRVLGGDRSAVGQKLVLNNESYEIVGVMPPEFMGPGNRGAELWSPFVFRPEQLADNNRTNEFLNFVGRLKPGVAIDQATSNMHAFAKRLKQDHPDNYPPDWDLIVTSLSERATGGLRPALYVLLGAVGLVLLIACANVANLQLARAASRAREIAVRVALGASHGRLIVQLLTESVLLAVVGGGLGLLFAVWGVPALLSLNGNNTLPTGVNVGLDQSVLLFTVVLSLITGLVFGLMPAWQLVRGDLHSSLKEGGRGAAGDRSGLRLRRGLVISTVAIALALLAGAGLLVRSFSRLLGVDPGFNPNHLLTFNISLPQAKYSNDTLRLAAFNQLTAAIASTNGVSSVGATSVIPFGGSWSTGSFSVEGYQPPANTPGPWGDIRLVTPGFLSTIQAPLLHGRQFNDQDLSGSPRVAIVDDQMVKRYWPKEDPIGKRITFNNLTDSSITWIEVVGVVGHTSHEGLDAPARVQVYFPFSQIVNGSLDFAVRTPGDPMSLLPALKQSLHQVDPDLPLFRVRSMSQLVELSTGPRRFSMLLLGIFSLLAVGLASLGLYGVMSYTVTQRAKELGVRLALGARSPDVLRLVLRQGMQLALVGIGVGLVAAIALTRLLKSMLFNVTATDPLTFIAISVLLVAVTLLATWFPARRATRVDPIIALRAE